MDTGSSGAIGLYTVVGFVSGAYRTLFDSERFAQEMRYTVTYLDQYAVRAQSENTGMNYYIDLAGKDAAELTRIYREDGTTQTAAGGLCRPYQPAVSGRRQSGWAAGAGRVAAHQRAVSCRRLGRFH